MEQLAEAIGELFDESDALYLQSAKRWPGLQDYAIRWAALAAESKQTFEATFKLPTTC
jgi:hypothetical protein